MENAALKQDVSAEAAENLAIRLSVNRFVSMLSGAFRALHIYKQDNKAVDEIMQALVHRSQDACRGRPLKLGITNRSILFEGEPIGFKELTVFLASQLRLLGFRELSFNPPPSRGAISFSSFTF